MSIGSTQPFRPTGTVSLAAGTTSISAALMGGGDSVVVTNATGSLAFVRFGADATVTASASDMPVLAGSRIMVAVNPLITHAAATLASGGGLVLLTRGDGSFL